MDLREDQAELIRKDWRTQLQTGTLPPLVEPASTTAKNKIFATVKVAKPEPTVIPVKRETKRKNGPTMADVMGGGILPPPPI